MVRSEDEGKSAIQKKIKRQKLKVGKQINQQLDKKMHLDYKKIFINTKKDVQP